MYSKKNVMEMFNISSTTLEKFYGNPRLFKVQNYEYNTTPFLIEGEDYYKPNKKTIVFFESAIIKIRAFQNRVSL